MLAQGTHPPAQSMSSRDLKRTFDLAFKDEPDLVGDKFLTSAMQGCSPPWIADKERWLEQKNQRMMRQEDKFAEKGYIHHQEMHEPIEPVPVEWVIEWLVSDPWLEERRHAEKQCWAWLLWKERLLELENQRGMQGEDKRELLTTIDESDL